MISETRAVELARKYRARPSFIRRLAVFAEKTSHGVNPFDALQELGIVAHYSVRRYRTWADRLGDELAAAGHEDTPNDEGDED